MQTTEHSIETLRAGLALLDAANTAYRAGLIDADLRRRIVEQVTINAGVTP